MNFLFDGKVSRSSAVAPKKTNADGRRALVEDAKRAREERKEERMRAKAARRIAVGTLTVI